MLKRTHFYRRKLNWFHVFMMRQGGIIGVIYDPVATCVQDKSSVTFYFISDQDKYTDFICLCLRPSLLNIIREFCEFLLTQIVSPSKQRFYKYVKLRS